MNLIPLVPSVNFTSIWLLYTAPAIPAAICSIARTIINIPYYKLDKSQEYEILRTTKLEKFFYNYSTKSKICSDNFSALNLQLEQIHIVSNYTKRIISAKKHDPLKDVNMQSLTLQDSIKFRRVLLMPYCTI